MTTLMAYYDKDVLKNIVSPLTLHPDKVVFLADGGIRDMTVFRSLETCFRRHIPYVTLEKYPVDVSSMEKIYRKTVQIIRENENCELELTGGSDLMVLAVCRAGMETGAELRATQLVHIRSTALWPDETVTATATVSLEDVLDATGPCLCG